MDEKSSYAYIYLDPRRSGRFDYGLSVAFLYEPFYVGRGTGSRFKRHINPSFLNGDNTIKEGKLRKIISDGFNPLNYVVFFATGLTRKQSSEIEIQLIQKIGRMKHNSSAATGPLSNLTDGDIELARASRSNKGKTYEQIYGSKKASWMKKIRRERFSGAGNPMFGKPSTQRGVKLSSARKRYLSKIRSKSVDQIDCLTGEIIKTHDSIKSATMNLRKSSGGIGNCLKGRAGTAFGFKWRYTPDV